MKYLKHLMNIGNWPDPEYDVSNWQSADEIEPSSFGELEPTLVS